MTLPLSQLATPPAWSEQKLVAATRAGNDRAFEALYARYRERIFTFILSKVHDHGRAEDIAQDVFMSALRRLRASDQAIAFKPWIYEIAKNACIDEYRRGSRAREVPLESDGEFVVDRQTTSVSAVPTPAAAVEGKQRLDDLRGAFGGLSASHHQLLVMREFEGLSYDEIGERLGMTRQMVESSLFRARRKLSEEYQELASGQRCEQIQTAIEAGRLRAVGSLGLRDRRRFARHLSHCQPCRHVALMGGVDEALIKPRSVAAKIAALLPFPVWRLSWRSRGAKASAAGSHHLAGGSTVGLASAAGSALTMGQTAATVAVLIAGAGGGLAIHELGASSSQQAAGAVHRTAAHSSSSTGSSASAAARAKAAHGTASLSGAHRTASLSIHRRATSLTTTRRPPKRTQTRRPNRGTGPGGPGAGKSGSSSSTGSSSPTQGTGSAGSGAPTAATKVVNGVSTTASGVTNGVATTVNGVASGVGTTVNGVASGVGTTVNGVASGVGTTVNGVASGVGTTVNGVASGVGTTVNGVVSGVSTTLNGVTSGNPAGVSSGVATTVNGVTSGVSTTVSGVTKGVGDVVAGATSGVKQTLTGVTSGVSDTLGGLTGALSGSH
jgi:RNA polymerase sigma factor (sigma-70 family)